MWRSLGSRSAIALVALVVATSSFAVGIAAGATPTWSIAPSPSAPDGAPTAPSAVSCLNAADCYAVGYYQIGRSVFGWIGHWNGSTWSRMTVPRPASTTEQYLRALTCLSTKNCFAVGTYNDPKGHTLVMHWNGSAWSIMPSPNPTVGYAPELSAVTCRSATNCFAVGLFRVNSIDSALKSLIMRWNGSAWSLMPHPRPTGVSVLSDVKCPERTSCFAVGGYGTGNGNKTLVERWNGSAWSIIPSPTPAGATSAGLNSLSCTSGTNCFAVGAWSTGGNAHTLVERWNGIAWSRINSPNAVAASNILRSVKCAGAAKCFAVGYIQTAWSSNKSLIQHWNGSAWSITTHPRPTGSSWLFSVSCPSGITCFAVGYYQTMGGTPVKPLVYAYR
jgi:hypothetical protein